MEMSLYFNNLNSLLESIYNGELLSLLGHYLYVFLLNFVSYIWILLKFYKVLCYSKMTFEWLPMINPYVWPFSVFHILTGPYFKFWSTRLPNVKFDKSSIEISAIIGLEALNSLVYFAVKVAHILLVLLDENEKKFPE
jgi:hypothetical protein